jgi:hypothetical protein
LLGGQLTAPTDHLVLIFTFRFQIIGDIQAVLGMKRNVDDRIVTRNSKEAVILDIKSTVRESVQKTEGPVLLSCLFVGHGENGLELANSTRSVLSTEDRLVKIVQSAADEVAAPDELMLLIYCDYCRREKEMVGDCFSWQTQRTIGNELQAVEITRQNVLVFHSTTLHDYGTAVFCLRTAKWSYWPKTNKPYSRATLLCRNCKRYVVCSFCGIRADSDSD